MPGLFDGRCGFVCLPWASGGGFGVHGMDEEACNLANQECTGYLSDKNPPSSPPTSLHCFPRYPEVGSPSRSRDFLLLVLIVSNQNTGFFPACCTIPSALRRENRYCAVSLTSIRRRWGLILVAGDVWRGCVLKLWMSGVDLLWMPLRKTLIG